MSAQFIEQDGRRAFAVVPIDEYERMLEALAELEDVEAVHALKAKLASGEEELVPEAVANALLDGANPVRVWREHRGMTQQELADASGFTKPYICQIERGNRQPEKAGTLAKLAKALRVAVEDVFPG